jgi:YD repeat-containing protein
MKRSSRLLAMFAVFLGSAQALAIVDMKTANYSQTWTDIDVPSAANQFKLKVDRTYNSRSLFDGIFGFGWCSDFETRLEVTPEGNIRLIECGSGQETVYMPLEFNRKDIDKTIAAILPKLRAQQGTDEKTLKTLQDEMISNAKLRAKYAAEFKIKVEPKEGMQYFANGREVEKFVYSKNIYTRTLVSGTQMRFNATGRMTHMYDAAGNFLRFEYDKDQVREVVDNNGRKLSFKYYNNKKVKNITGPGGSTAEYKFEGLDDLNWVKNQWGNVYVYEYDDRHNLVKVQYPDKTQITIGYNQERDWVTKFSDRDKCNEEYGYELSKSDPKMHYWSTVKKVCRKEIVNESKHEFIHKKRDDGQIYLSRVISTINGAVTDITYHEIFGRPLSIRRNAEMATFEYFPNGQIKVKSTRLTKMAYQYDDKSKKVADVVTTVLNDKGKAVTSRKTAFQYDPKGNLIFASNTEGQRVRMTYDGRGRIKTITDQARKVVKIDYEERFGKPAIVSRPGLGTIRVSYKANGDIDKVNSAEGPTVAMQVASTFNNLLDILSPASPEVYN